MSEDSSLQETAEVSVEWKIMSYAKLVGQFVDSPTFLLSDAKWFLRILPNGEEDFTGYVALYLYRKFSSSRKHAVSFTMGIRNTDGSTLRSVDFEFEYKVYCGYGTPALLRSSEVLQSVGVVAPDGSVTMFCTARISTTRAVGEIAVETVPRNPSFESVENLQQNFNDLFMSGREGDVTFKVQDTEFQAHRLILSARSPVFFAMFDHETEEKKTGVVNIVDCDPECFICFLIFLYTGKMDIVPSNKVVLLYRTADKYNFKDLMKECVLLMAEELSVETFCDVIRLASMQNESELLKTATDFFIENAKIIFQNSEWESLLREHSALANTLLKNMAFSKL